MFFTVSTLKPGQQLEAKGKLAGSPWLKEALSSLDAKVKELEFRLTVEKKGDFVEVEGWFKGETSISCVRCLKEFNIPFDQKFRVFLYSEDGTYAGDGGEHELNDNDMEFAFFRGDKVDIGEVLREQLILILPDYPTCSPNCSGIHSCENHKKSKNTDCCNCDANKNPFGELKNLKLKK